MVDTVQASYVGAIRRAPDRERAADPVDALIAHRARQAGPDEEARAWRESERQDHQERREARCWQWITHYRRLARSLRVRAESLERKAESLAAETVQIHQR